MNMYYLCMSLLECLAALEDRLQGNNIMHLSTCDLQRVPTLVMLAGCLSSAAMLAYKAAHIEVIQMKWMIQTRLEKERAELIEEVRGTEVGEHIESLSSSGASNLQLASSNEDFAKAINLPLQPVALVDPCLSAP